jgi:hypothetical protein
MKRNELLSLVAGLTFCGVLSSAQSNQSGVKMSPQPTAPLSGSLTANLRAHDDKKSIVRLRADRLSESKPQEAWLDMESDYTGPSDPMNPAVPLICDPAVQRAIDKAWSSSVQAAHRPPTAINDKVEFGFAINVDIEGKSLLIQPMQTSDLTDRKLNELDIPVGENTIATVHTHNTGARPTPSAADLISGLPGFVKSQFYIFVTIPGTNRYAAVDLKRVCRVNKTEEGVPVEPPIHSAPSRGCQVRPPCGPARRQPRLLPVLQGH